MIINISTQNPTHEELSKVQSSVVLSLSAASHAKLVAEIPSASAKP